MADAPMTTNFPELRARLKKAEASGYLVSPEPILLLLLSAYDARGTELADKDGVIAGLREERDLKAEREWLMTQNTWAGRHYRDYLSRLATAEAEVSRLTSEAAEREVKLEELRDEYAGVNKALDDMLVAVDAFSARVAALEEALREASPPIHLAIVTTVLAERSQKWTDLLGRIDALLQPQEQTDARDQAMGGGDAN